MQEGDASQPIPQSDQVPLATSEIAPEGGSFPAAARSHLPISLLAALLAVVTVVLYWPVMHHDFINYDDDVYVTANYHVQNGMTLRSIKWAFGHPVSGNWHPVTILSHMLDCQLFGLEPWGHHLTSLLLHALNTVLVFLLLCRLTGAVWRSMMVAALFGWHPLHVESVAWVAERKDVLSTAFGLIALIFYERYARAVQKSEVGGRRSEEAGSREGRSEVRGQKSEVGSQESEAGPMLSPGVPVRLTDAGSEDPAYKADDFRPVGPPATAGLPSEQGTECMVQSPKSKGQAGGGRSFYWASLLALALGLMSKPMLVTWPCVMLLLDYWPLGRFKAGRIWPLVREKVPFFILAAAAGMVAFMMQKLDGAVVTVANLPLAMRSENALVSYGCYLDKLFWPTDMAVFYPLHAVWSPRQLLLAGGFLGGLSLMLFLQRRQYPFLLMGWLWFVGTLVPVIGLVKVGDQAMADRYMYIPALGILILAVWGSYEVARYWRFQALALSVAGAAAIVLCLILTRKQLRYWQDSETVFRHTLAITRSNYIAHEHLGDALLTQDQTDAAIKQYQEALRLKPNFAIVHNNFGFALARQGHTNEAISQFQRALRLKPDLAQAHLNLGNVQFNQGRTTEAINQFQEALRLEPDNVACHNCLGDAFFNLGQIDAAISQYQQALRIKPDDATAQSNLANSLELKNAPKMPAFDPVHR